MYLITRPRAERMETKKEPLWIMPHRHRICREDRNLVNNHASFVVWLTGLSGSGKSTLANLLEQELHSLGIRTYVLDGDNIRTGLNRDLGFSQSDRIENIRRVAEVAGLMVDAGLVVITAFISPYSADREMARNLIGPDRFIEVFIDATLESCEARDVKGLYQKARAGLIKEFTGIDAPFEPPQHPHLTLPTHKQTIEESLAALLSAVREKLPLQ